MAERIKDDDPDAISTRDGWARWQEHQAKMRALQRTEVDVVHARFYLASARDMKPDDKDKAIYLECERANDARNVAQRLLGNDAAIREVREEAIVLEIRKAARVQVRWVGSAAGRVPDLRMQTRRIDEHGNAARWRDF